MNYKANHKHSAALIDGWLLGLDKKPLLQTTFVCEGTESSLDECRRSNTAKDCYSDDVGVSCSTGSSSLLPPHQRCAAHTLNLVASKDSEAALQDGVFRTASRSLFAKAQAVWSKQSRAVSAAENIQEAMGRKMIIPNQSRWNSTYDAVQCLQDLTAEQLTKLADALGLPSFTPRDQLFMKEFVMGYMSTHTGWDRRAEGQVTSGLPTNKRKRRVVAGGEEEGGRVRHSETMLSSVLEGNV
ncbi:hypothetical protein C0Q70_11962 [Pomacea canaliculata]|uniref:SRCR domain-containing protein n=1 Tax=Pomacea canaliculata TaxID=400727 RepID=A0A2T7P080_POMCA|nr:hypothetical protein C0Q70_11962 [Pomacea canaliculata]